MSNKIEDFFQNMIEKLSILNEEISKQEFFEDICNFFDISHAFIYEYNYLGDFIKKEFFEKVHKNSLPESINIKEELGLKLMSELCSQKIVLSIGQAEKSDLEKALIKIFNVKTLIFIPILNQHYELAGFVGLCDRRKEIRNADVNINKACALLTLLANTMKLELFQKGIANTEAALSNVLDHIGIDIYVNDYYTHDILYVNKSMAAPYGGVENMIGKKCWASIFTDKSAPCDFCPQPRLLDENGKLNKTYQWDYERPFDKSWFRVLSSSFPWTDGRIAHLVASIDITESKRNQMVIEKLALFDYLTGLANRRSLNEDINLFAQDHKKFGEKWYLIFSDLDGFKTINDTLGHAAGDVLLKEIAKDLLTLCTDDFKAYRLGGDEFVFILRDDGNFESIQNAIDNLFKVFRTKHYFEEHEMVCDCSMGIAHYPSFSCVSRELFQCADAAMYAVKKSGKGSVLFCFEDNFIDLEQYKKMMTKDNL